MAITGYNLKIEYAKYPVVNAGSAKKPMYYIVDVCLIPEGASFSGELATVQRQNMIRFSCRKPHENYHSIVEEGLKLIGCADRLLPWGLKTDGNMVTVPGRRLPIPQIKYAERTARVEKGGWNLRDQKFVQGATVKEWTGLLIHWENEKPADHNAFLKQFHSVAKGLTVNWPAPILPHLRLAVAKGDKNVPNWMRALNENFEKQRGRVQLLVVILPNGGDRIFEYVKWIGDVRHGLLTHCCMGSKLMKQDLQYAANNAMKVNLKFGGVCQTLGNPHPVIKTGTTMVVGLDVTHPSATDPGNFPSVAGIVASTDKQLGQWPGEVRIQEGRNEQVVYLKEMMLGRLQRWRESNKGVLPSNIIIFRDGVSEGQFKMILNNELQSVRDAVQAIYKGTQPRITVLVVGKRHNVRFYPTRKEDMSDKQNCWPGTIVDRDITRPVYWDWYLQSQAPLQGSARPAHYIVIHDEIFSSGSPTTNPSDSLQELSNTICYMMGRCTRSISYCTPAFLADRFCDRGRKYVRAYYYEAEKMRNQRYPPAPSPNTVTLNPSCRERMVYI